MLRDGAKLHDQARPGAALPLLLSQLLTDRGWRAKVLSPDEEEQGGKPKSFSHHLLKTRNPKCRFLAKHHLRLGVNASLFRLTPRHRNPNRWPKATRHNSTNCLKGSHPEPVTVHILETTALPSVLILCSALHLAPGTCLIPQHLTGRQQDSG